MATYKSWLIRNEGSEFVSNYIHLWYYKYNKINLYSAVKYTNYTEWIKKAINSTSKKYKKHFQEAVTVALILGEIKKYLQRITKIKPFMNKYNWERKYVPSEKDDWKKIEKNNVTYILLMFQNITEIVKRNILIFLF